MLQFIFGLPKSGKTFTLHGKIKECADKNLSVAIIVPEQFSFESERFVLESIGNAALNVKVLSFSRLCDEIGRISGGIAGAVLSESDKVIIMKRAVKSVKESLGIWGRFAGSANFAAAMIDTVDEFKLNAVTPLDLRNAAKKVSNVTLKAKLNDTALIFDAYNEIAGERFIDPTDKLTKLYIHLENNEYFKNKAVFFDGFTGFTGQQYKIINRIFSQTDNVTFSFTNDIENADDFNIFSNIRAVVEKVRKTAKKYGIAEETPVFLNKSRYETHDLNRLERLLSGRAEKAENSTTAVTVFKAENTAAEARFAAHTIRKSVRENGYMYRDFTVIARNTATYEAAFLSACRENGVNVFTDSKVSLSGFCMAVAVNCALELAKQFKTENVLRFYKTGMGGLDINEISTLENYVLLWNIEGGMWFKEWDMDVRGMTTEPQTDETSEKLQKINELREKAVKPLCLFKNDLKGNTVQMAKAIVNLIKSTGMQRHLGDMCDRFEAKSDTYSADILRQSYNLYMGIIDSTVRCLGEDSEDLEDFTSSLKTAVSLATVGISPQTLDEVTFCGANHIPQNRPKVIIILGANLGVFPQTVSNSGILTTFEREILINGGLEISDNSVKSTIEENFLVYTNLCSASEKVYVGYSEKTLAGESMEPAAFIGEITDCLKPEIISVNNENMREFYPETKAAAYTAVCENIKQNMPYAKAVVKALNNNGVTVDYNDFTPAARNKISKETALKLYNGQLYMSASKVDVFHSCPFSYFCKYGLRATKPESVEFNVLQRGTITHYVLEKLVKNQGEVLAQLSEAEIENLTGKYLDEYLSNVDGFASVKGSYFSFLISKIKRIITDVAVRLSREFAQCEFKPVGCEVEINFDGDLNPIQLPLENGKLILTGSIDRMDEYKGYIRVIDYKTGNRTFSLPDVLFGLNLQMLIYLYAATRGNGKADDTAAGILYMSAKRNTTESTDTQMSGLLLKNKEVVRAMEKSENGEFVPKLITNKDGNFRKSNKFVDSEAFTDIFNLIEETLINCGNRIQNGDIAVSPLDSSDRDACKYCDYGAICMIEKAEHKNVPKMNLDKVLENLKGGEQIGE